MYIENLEIEMKNAFFSSIEIRSAICARAVIVVAHAIPNV